MKIFQVLFGLLLFGFINSSTETIIDLEVSTKYTFTTDYKNIYFRVKVSSLHDMYFQLSANDIGTNSQGDFKFDICGFHDYPSDNQVITGHSSCLNYIIPSLERKSGDVYYKYISETLEDIYYLSISLYMTRDDIFPKTLYINSKKKVEDLNILTEYIFLIDFTNYYFRVKISSLDNMYLQLSANDIGTNSQGDFKFDICGYKNNPSNDEIINSHEYCANDIIPSLVRTSDYIIYKYIWETLEDINYLSFHLTMKRNDVYPYKLYLYAEEKKGETQNSTEESSGSVGIILLIIFLPCIIIAAIVVVVCRFFCGGCRLRIGGGSNQNLI